MSKFSTQVIPNAVPRALACRSPSMADPVDPARRKSSEYDIYVIYMYHFADMPHGYASIEIFTYNLVLCCTPDSCGDTKFCVKFSQNHSESVYLMGWIGIVATFFSEAVFCSAFFNLCFFTFGLLFILFKNIINYWIYTYKKVNIIGFLIESQLIKKKNTQNNTQTIFQGVIHEQPWSSIACLLWGVQLFFGMIFSKILSSAIVLSLS